MPLSCRVILPRQGARRAPRKLCHTTRRADDEVGEPQPERAGECIGFGHSEQPATQRHVDRLARACTTDRDRQERGRRGERYDEQYAAGPIGASWASKIQPAAATSAWVATESAIATANDRPSRRASSLPATPANPYRWAGPRRLCR
jgi:hypothetical protein